MEHSHTPTVSLFFAKLTNALCALLVVTMLVGCGGDPGPTGPERVQTFPITGKVLVDGKVPVQPNILVINAHLEGGSKDNPASLTPNSLASSEDGSFSISTYESGDGAAAGTYKLTFKLAKFNMMRARFTGDDFNGKYDNPAKSEHTVTVTGDETEPIDLGTIELTSK